MHNNCELAVNYDQYKIGVHGFVYIWGRAYKQWVRTEMTINEFAELKRQARCVTRCDQYRDCARYAVVLGLKPFLTDCVNFKYFKTREKINVEPKPLQCN